MRGETKTCGPSRRSVSRLAMPFIRPWTAEKGPRPAFPAVGAVSGRQIGPCRTQLAAAEQRPDGTGIRQAYKGTHIGVVNGTGRAAARPHRALIRIYRIFTALAPGGRRRRRQCPEEPGFAGRPIVDTVTGDPWNGRIGTDDRMRAGLRRRRRPAARRTDRPPRPAGRHYVVDSMPARRQGPSPALPLQSSGRCCHCE